MKVRLGDRTYTAIDLTHPLSKKIPTWNEAVGFEATEDELRMLPSAGTHIDAPVFFSQEMPSIDQIPLTQLIAPACVIDVSKKAKPNYRISEEDIFAFERQHGPIPNGSIAVGYTGWSRYWNDPKAYRNALQFPTFALSALEELIKRGVVGIAIDTLALEPLGGSDYPGHKMTMEAGLYIIENLANGDQLPPRGAYILALPLKVEKGEEAPARVIGLI